MKKFMVTEIRKTEQGQLFAVDTTYAAETKQNLINFLEKNPSKVVDKNYRIKEILDEMCFLDDSGKPIRK